MIRLYYWFLGVDEKRPGGPWWYRDFVYEDDLETYLRDLKRFLHRYARVLRSSLPEHDPTDIYPPDEAEEIEVNE